MKTNAWLVYFHLGYLLLLLHKCCSSVPQDCQTNLVALWIEGLIFKIQREISLKAANAFVSELYLLQLHLNFRI